MYVRRSIAVFIACSAFVCAAFAASVRIAAADPVPASATCPDTPARTLRAAQPIAPAGDISGEVVVTVTLDRASRIVSTAVARSTSPLLNAPALQAARASTYQTRTHDCAGVADSYNFVVRFGGLPDAVVSPAPAGTAPQALAYFRGTWSCTSAAGSATVKAVGFGVARTAYVSTNAYVTPYGDLHGVVETYTQSNSQLTMRETGYFNFTGSSHGWDGKRLVFTGTETVGNSVLAQTMTFERIGDNEYARSIATRSSDAAPPAVTSGERCERIAPASAPGPTALGS